jgi:hypothetical protein
MKLYESVSGQDYVSVELIAMQAAIYLRQSQMIVCRLPDILSGRIKGPTLFAETHES